MIDTKIYKFFADLIYNKTGIFYPEKDYYRLDGRLNTLIAHYGCKDARELYVMFTQNMTPDMERHLIDLGTNNETYFFRDNKPFTALTKDIIPNLAKENPGGMISIWSCASSTGQEPLSILMSIMENNPTLSTSQLEIYATDISSKALDKCRSGNYSNLEVQRGLPITMLMKYFDNEEDGSWTAKKSLSSKIHYDEFNLLTSVYPQNRYDIIFCRNVLIYQDQENKDKILHKMLESLRPGGYFIMGAGESLIGTTVSMDQNTLSDMMVFRKPEFRKTAA